MAIDLKVNRLEERYNDVPGIHIKEGDDADDKYSLDFWFSKKEDLTFDIRESEEGYTIQTSIPYEFN